MPVVPDSLLLAEYQTLVQAAGWCLLEGWTQLAILGRDRTTFLNGMCTNDIRRLQPGQGCEAFVTNVQGKTVGHVTLFCHDDRFDVVSVPGQAESLIKHWDRYVIREDVRFSDETGSRQLFLLSGQNAEDVLRRLLNGVSLPVGLLDHCTAEVAGRTINVRRCEQRPAPIFHLACSAADGSGLTEALTTAGARPCRADAVEMLRIETGWPWFGRDIDSTNLPQEVGRNERAISFTKGCYLGQETIARIDALGHVNWRLMGLSYFIPEDAWDSVNELQTDGKTVARITSRSYSPQLGTGLALGYVRRGWEKPGTKLPGPAGDATVVALPV